MNITVNVRFADIIILRARRNRLKKSDERKALNSPLRPEALGACARFERDVGLTVGCFVLVSCITHLLLRRINRLIWRTESFSDSSASGLTSSSSRQAGTSRTSF